ncbi:MAG: hypothetical protein WA783_09015 [Phormidesmis sp.]
MNTLNADTLETAFTQLDIFLRTALLAIRISFIGFTHTLDRAFNSLWLASVASAHWLYAYTKAYKWPLIVLFGVLFLTLLVALVEYAKVCRQEEGKTSRALIEASRQMFIASEELELESYKVDRISTVTENILGSLFGVVRQIMFPYSGVVNLVPKVFAELTGDESGEPPP